ncbi:EAL domain-containing protein [Wenzhouxiangella sp. XN24]|uniref:putative bifunctional diguanylate cyclase/phosphodiesterase n=1 Tax=Wenzhouxiangella sp. XN24 TaxID=2713569 RepID=UPI0013EC0D31|nr:EAL domain-containing protein [Wenzhouxiangella sp. XN24]NGX17529.1 EAL domain-containing protein [Wenzhouxiangella sp. XN24]
MSSPPIRVLVIDDDEEDAMIIADMLHDDPEASFVVEQCTLPQQYWPSVAAQQHDIYLVDYRLGPESGLELIRRAAREGITRPMILLTGQGGDGVDQLALKAGAADYLVKGHADFTQFARAIRYAIERGEYIGRLAASESQYRHLFERSPVPLLLLEPVGLKFVAVNDAAAQQLGFSKDELLEQSLPSLFAPGELERYLGLKDTWPRGYFEAGVWSFLRKNGSVMHADVVRHELDLEGMTGKLILARDVTDKVETQEKLREQSAALARAATHDRLTGLVQLETFEARFAAMVTEAVANETPLALYFIDLDRFHTVNETLGPAAGDSLLVTVAQRLREAFPPDSLFGRFAGDEFIVAVALDAATPEPEAFAGLARAVIAAPVETGDYSLYPSCSIGIAICPDHGDELSSLLRLAEAAMMRAKAYGRNRTQMFDARMGRELQDRLAIGARLRRAVQSDELDLHYQPFFDALTGRLAGFEALARWDSPELGMVSPGRFIPVAEQLGLILDIGRWVLNEACRQMRSWRDAGMPLLPVAVNVSAVQLQQEDFSPYVAALMRRYRLPEGAIEIEMTESALLVNPEQVVANLQALRHAGVRLSIDDFGTGFSSLSYLKQLAIAKLKIDRSFVIGLPENANDAAIANTIVTIAHQLGMTVTAEGVETSSQREFLCGLGCEYLQGYLLGRPLPADQAEQLMRQGGAPRSSLPTD